MAISETKDQGVKSYPYPVKEGQRYINLNPDRLFVQQPKKDRKDQLNYNISTYNREDNYRTAKLN